MNYLKALSIHTYTSNVHYDIVHTCISLARVLLSLSCNRSIDASICCGKADTSKQISCNLS